MLHYFLSAVVQHWSVRRYLILAFVTGLMLPFGVPVTSVSAATYTWTGSGSNGNWGDIFQWAGFNAPPTGGVNTDIVLRGSDTSPDIQGIGNNNVNYDIDSIILSPLYTGGSTMFLSGGDLTVDNEIVNDSAQELQFNSVVHLGDQFLAVDASIGDIIFHSAVDATGANPIISVSGLGDVFFDGGIAGGSDTMLNVLGGTFVRIGGALQSLKELNVSGSGTVQLRNSFVSFPSELSVNLASDATFDLNNIHLLMNRLSGNGSVDLGTATLTLQHNLNSTFSGIISGAGNIRHLSSSGTLTLLGNNSYTGTTTITGGAIRIFSSSNLGSGDIHFDFGDGTLETTGTMTNSRAVTIGADNSATFDVTGAFTQSGLISGNATTVLIKKGGGTFTTTATFGIPFRGDIEINEGVFDLAGSGNVLSEDTNVAIGSLGTFSVNNPEGVGNLSGSGLVVLNQQLNVGFDDASTTYAGVISGAGGLAKMGTGTLSLLGDSSYTGATTITRGTIKLGDSSRLSDDTDVAVGALGTFDLNGFGEVVHSISGAGTIRLGGGTLSVGEVSGTRTFSGDILEAGEIGKKGGGTLVLAGNNTFSLLNIKNGIVQVSHQGNLGSGSIVLGTGGFFDTGTGTFRTTDSFTNVRPILTTSPKSIIHVDNGTTLTQSGVVSGTLGGGFSQEGALTKRGGGTLVLAASNTYRGDTSIEEGVVRLDDSERIGNGSQVVILSGASLDLDNNAESVGGLLGVGEVDTGGSAGRLRVRTGSWGGDITGSGGLTKIISGFLHIQAPQSYTGSTLIDEGTLRLFGAGQLSDATDVTIASGATWDLNDISDTVDSINGAGSVLLGGATLTVDENSGSTRTFSGVISESGTFVKKGTHTLTLAEANTYTGPTSIDGGTLRLSGNGKLSTSTDVNVAAGATFDLISATTSINNLTGSGSVVLNSNSALFVGQNGGSSTFGGVVSGAGDFAHLGAGTLTLTGNNTYTGTTSIALGTIKLGASDRLADSTDVDVLAAAATFDLNGMDETVDSIGGAGSILLGGGTLQVGAANGSRTFSGVISGTGELRKVGKGSQVLTGANTFTGTTFVDGGELALSGGGSIDQQTMAIGHNPGDDGTVTVDGPATTWNLNNKLLIGSNGGAGRLNISNGATVTVASQVGIGSSLSVGTLSLDGGTFELSSGKIFIDIAGILQGQGDVLGDILSNGTVSPGNSAGILSATSSYVQNASGSLLIEIGGTILGTEYDQLDITGTARLDGELRVQLIDGFVPSINDVFEILKASNGVVDVFATESLPNLGDGMDWDVQYNAFGAVLEVIATFTADFDLDGDVDGEDLTDPINGWEARYGVDLDGGNFLDWQRQFGSGVPLLASSQAVPEPNTIVLLLLGFLGLLVPRQLGFRFFFRSTFAVVTWH